METHQGTVSGTWRTLVTIFLAGGLLMAHAAPKPTVNSAGSVLIERQPESQALWKGSSATFSVVAAGLEPLEFQWYKNWTALTNNDRVRGVTTDVLSISNLIYSDAANYNVVVRNSLDTVLGATATLSVLGPPEILKQTTNLSLSAGWDYSLWVSVEGGLPLSIQWSRDGIDIPGATGSSLMITNVQVGDAARVYAATVTNAYGSARSGDLRITVTDSPPRITQDPGSQTMGVGGSARFTVKARGSDPLAYQWRFNGEDIPGATEEELVLDNLRSGQTGYYSVIVSNAFGLIFSRKAQLSVLQVVTWVNYNSNLVAGPAAWP